MIMKCFIVALLVLSLLANADVGRKEDERPSRIHGLQTMYRLVTNQEPTLENLLDSLRPKPAGHLEKIGEAITAVELIGLTAGQSIEARAALVDRLNQAGDWGIMNMCVEALLELDPPEGTKRGESLLNDPAFDLEGKLSLAFRLLDKGSLSGYSILREGLDAESRSARRKAFALLELLRPHDGAAWNARGDKIDLRVFPSGVLNYTERKEALFQRYGFTKYGYPGQTIEIPPYQGDQGYIIDASAWSISFKEDGEILKAVLKLDPIRYKGAAQLEPILALTGIASTGLEQARVNEGEYVSGIVRIPMAFTTVEHNTFSIELGVPKAERGRFMIQIVANVEPGWKVMSHSALPR